MIAQLQLNNFFTDSLSVKTNQFFDPKIKDGLISGKINCSTEIAIPKDGIQIPSRVVLVVSIEPATEKPALEPYELKIKIVGFFTFNGEMASDQKERMLGLNGASILYGVARGIIAQTTGGGIYGKYILPAVNFVDILEKENQVKEARAKAEAVAKGALELIAANEKRQLDKTTRRGKKIKKGKNPT